MVEDIDIIIESLYLYGLGSTPITDKALSNKLGTNNSDLNSYINNKLYTYLRPTKLSNILCPYCNKESKPYINEGKFICGFCGKKTSINDLATIEYNINYDNTQKFIEVYIINILTKNNFKLLSQDKHIFKFNFEGNDISCILSLNVVLLNDYFLLRGKEPDVDNYILFGIFADEEIIALSKKDLKCNIFTLKNITDSKYLDRFLNELRKDIDLYKQNAQSEKDLKYEFTDLYNLNEIRSKLDNMLKRLPFLAHQKCSETLREQTDEFEMTITSLLNFTLMKTKHLGSQNSPDGMAYLFKMEEVMWVPLEMKTYKTENIDEPYLIKDVISQLRKYSEALTSDLIRRKHSVPLYFTIAHHFRENDPDEREQIDRMETDFKIHYCFISLSGFIEIINRSLLDEIFYVDPDDIITLFRRYRFIGTKEIDEIFSEIVKRTKYYDEGDFRDLRRKIKTLGK